jgi:hypothetical protein
VSRSRDSTGGNTTFAFNSCRSLDDLKIREPLSLSFYQVQKGKRGDVGFAEDLRRNMREDYCDISIVLDRSGSMESVKADTIGGYNAFLEGQKKAPGRATITLAQFDHVYEKVYEGMDIKNAEPLDNHTFQPRGTTALLDAIGRTIEETGRRLAAMVENERPGKVVFVILTDGEENSSKKFTAEQINSMIQHQRDAYQWEFVFLGANQDAINTASRLGIAQQNALSYAANSAGTRAAFASTSKNLVSYRAGIVKHAAYSSEDRLQQTEAGVDSKLNKAS